MHWSDGLGPSQGGGLLLCTLREFVGVASPLVDPVGLCPVDSLGSLGFLSGVSSALSSVPSFSSGPSLFPSSSGVTSQRLPCLSLLLVTLFPRPFLPFLRLASLFSSGLFWVSSCRLCFLALPWLLLSPPSLLSPYWFLRSPPCLTWFLTCWHQSSLPHCALALLLFLSFLPLCLSFPHLWVRLLPPHWFLGWRLLRLLVSPPVPSWLAPLGLCFWWLSVQLLQPLHFLLLLLLFCPRFWLLALFFSFVNPVASSEAPPPALPGGSWSSPGLYADVGQSHSSLSAGPHDVGQPPSSLSAGPHFYWWSFGYLGYRLFSFRCGSDFDKGEFSNSFQEMIALITSYFPSSKPSISSDSGSLIPWLDVSGNVYKHSPLVFLNLFKKLAAIHKEVDEKFLKAMTRRRRRLPLSFLGVRFTG